MQFHSESVFDSVSVFGALPCVFVNKPVPAHRLYLGELLGDEPGGESQDARGVKLGGVRRRFGDPGLICKG